MDILETIAALDLKVARCRQIMESIKVGNQLCNLVCCIGDASPS